MRTIMGRLEAVRIDIEKTIDDSQSRTHWRTLVRSVLMYWLGELFNEGQAHTKNLQTALDISQKQVEAFKLVNADLQDEIRILRKQHY